MSLRPKAAADKRVVPERAQPSPAKRQKHASELSQFVQGQPAATSSTPEPSEASVSPWGQTALPALLPADDATLSFEGFEKLMDAVGSHVTSALPIFLKEHGTEPALAAFKQGVPVHQHQPLKLPDTTSDTSMSSYKAAWNSEHALQSLGQTGMFEAAANITWLCPFTRGRQAQIIAGDRPMWAQVVQVANTYMVMDAYQSGSLASSQGLVKRLLFPIVVPVRFANLDAAAPEMFESTMRVVAGHVYVWGWYLGMHKALLSGDARRFASLWQMGLTTSVHARQWLTESQLALWSIQSSESVRMQERVICDSVQAFALKCLALVPDEQMSEQKASKVLADAGVTFRGSRPNTCMANAVLLFRHSIDAVAIEWLRKIAEVNDGEGRDLFNAGYSKLARLVQTCNEAAKVWGVPVATLLNLVLGALEFTLRMSMLKVGDLTVAALDKSRDGVPGLAPKILGFFGILHHISMTKQDLQGIGQCDSLVHDLERLFSDLQEYEKYERAFSPSKGTPDSEDDDACEKYKKAHMHTKCGILAVDFFYALFCGKHDGPIGEMLRERSWTNCNWSELELPGLDTLVRPMSLQRTVVISDGAPPVAGARTLQRYNSDAEDEVERSEKQKERAEAWKKAGTMRRKLVTFLSPKTWTAAELDSLFEQSTLHKHKTLAGSQHRVFVYSADLLHEMEATPWNKLPDWKVFVNAPALQFLLKQGGDGDVLVACDGRSRECRKALDREMATIRHLSEIWVVFKPSPRLGRRVCFGSDNKEVVMISTPVARTQLVVKERKGVGVGAGESSTHDASYTGVAPLPWSGAPMVSREDKERILGGKVQQPRPQLFDSALGMPLFWAERKSVQFWKTLFQDLSATWILDVSPGSGTAARAAMQLGLPYLGIARNFVHMDWLSNVADRAALQQICKAGTPLFHQDMPHAISEHFQYILDAWPKPTQRKTMRRRSIATRA